jgi:pimeloyl-ACP methyl ester carboxylesterase
MGVQTAGIVRASYPRLLLHVAALALVASGCASIESELRPRPVAGISDAAIVYVADGAGNFQIASRSLRAVVNKDGYPIRVKTWKWSHGYGRVIADQVCFEHAKAEGRRLAEEVVARHDRHPDTPIYLVGHSAGSAVVVTALEHLPAGIVDRAILLSPSLSTCYDLEPALAAVKRGIHVFYSQHDYWYLGMVTGLLGTSDRRWCCSSGRYGFDAPARGPATGLYAKLFQRAWHPTDVHVGNFGGHYGNYQPDFLRTRVVPLLQP